MGLVGLNQATLVTQLATNPTHGLYVRVQAVGWMCCGCVGCVVLVGSAQAGRGPPRWESVTGERPRPRQIGGRGRGRVPDSRDGPRLSACSEQRPINASGLLGRQPAKSGSSLLHSLPSPRRSQIGRKGGCVGTELTSLASYLRVMGPNLGQTLHPLGAL